MPESRRRKRPAYTAPQSTHSLKKRPPSPPWVGGSILGLFVVGIVYLVLYYVSGGGILGQQHLGGWNILIGFAFIVAGFAMLTQWN
jgi:hypothetical protein